MCARGSIVSASTPASHVIERNGNGKTIPLTMNINPFTDSDDDSRQIQQLNRRISQLGPFDRAIILLWLENMSYEEIGEIVGISTKNVSVRLFRIKEKLKKTSETTKE